MVSLNKVLEQASRLREDAFDDETKAAWLIELEGRLYREVLLRHQLEGEPPARAERFPEDGDLPLLASGEYEGLYLLYLLTQIDRSNRETDQYNVSALAFNDALSAWAQAYHRTHAPIPALGYGNLF